MPDKLEPVTVQLENIPWTPHPTIPGIEIRMFQNPEPFSPSDVLIARIEAGSKIPWHVHEQESEIAYILQGSATLYTAPAKPEDSPAVTESDFVEGVAGVIPPGLWHSVVNTGDATVLILALHTP